MFGIRFIKSQPTVHLMQFRRGRIVREGAGVAFHYFSPTSTMVAVPVASQDAGFMLELPTADFQGVTVQGEVTYRVGQPQRIAAMMDFSVKPDGKTYVSDDPQRLRERVVMQVNVIIRQAVQALELKQALVSSSMIARAAQQQLAAQPEIQALGLEVLGVSIVAIKPTPDIARALEAEARESHLKAADDAIYQRRMAAVRNERAIREHELATEIGLEENRKQLVASQIENARALADAEADRVRAVMEAFEKADTRVVQALASAGMQPGQLIAQAFGGIAEKAERIGQLNVSPDLLRTLMAAPPSAARN
ncbi:SPFH domain-containing protein [Ramlibacter albus]|uniref:SPFH domain-containing protein n=1 Tax=Ramlibacter albus TaxID=2079448 RepID=A0A923S1Z9_9BURK|nr:SPFH domain-containing protein [Ramlibacter albus]MBC5764959.1 SPFH domain-containing protein [Ramlibacter albus]